MDRILESDSATTKEQMHQTSLLPLSVMAFRKSLVGDKNGKRRSKAYCVPILPLSFLYDIAGLKPEEEKAQ